MGETGMGEMGAMGMKVPRNSFAHAWRRGPFWFYHHERAADFTQSARRDHELRRSGWYQHPEGTVATVASSDQLSRDGIDVDVSPTKHKTEKHQHSG